MPLLPSSSASRMTPYRLRTYVEPLDPYFEATTYEYEHLGANLNEAQRNDVEEICGPLPWICGGRFPSGCVIEV